MGDGSTFAKQIPKGIETDIYKQKRTKTDKSATKETEMN